MEQGDTADDHEHQSERPQKQYNLSGEAENQLTKRGRSDNAAGSQLDGIPARRLERDPGDDAGERDTQRHIIVDADHVGPQALIDRNRPVRTDAASGSRVVPVEIRHGRYLSLIPTRGPDGGTPYRHRGWHPMRGI